MIRHMLDKHGRTCLDAILVAFEAALRSGRKVLGPFFGGIFFVVKIVVPRAVVSHDVDKEIIACLGRNLHLGLRFVMCRVFPHDKEPGTLARRALRFTQNIGRKLTPLQQIIVTDDAKEVIHRHVSL